MAIYGVAFLSLCMMLGVWIGNLLGKLLGINSDVGGVGFAMLILVLLTEWAERRGYFTTKARDGVNFWSMMYIPIVVAMAMSQNVVGAISGGPTALVAGVLSVVVMFALVRPISNLATKSTDWDQQPK